MIDFLVIGGGIAGMSTAARLSHLGRVTVLEAETGLGYHASGRSAAMFEESYGLESTIALNRASKAYLQNSSGGVLSGRGLMLLGSQHDRDAFDDDMADMKMQPITMDQAVTMVPILDRDVVVQAGYHEDAWDIDTDLLIQNFAREARGNHGVILTNQRVQGISKTTTGWQVQTNSRTYGARVLVNAAGAWVDQIAMMAGVTPIGFTPFRRSVARIPAPDGLNISDWPMLFGPGEQWYAKPDAGLLLVSPAEEDLSTPHDAWPDDMVLAQGLARYEAVVTQTITRLDSSWAGLRTFSPDCSLVLGRDSRDESFIWVAGQGGYGFQTSAAASQLVADLVAGRKSELDQKTVAALSPARFSS